MSNNIKVVVKVRPLMDREIKYNVNYQWRLVNNTLYQIDTNGRGRGLSFTFDKVYDMKTRIDVVYQDVGQPAVEAAIAGINTTIMAYGQTLAGKTYTMAGSDDAPGLIKKIVTNLFDIIKSLSNRHFVVRVSYLKIRNEKIVDLLNISRRVRVQQTPKGIQVSVTKKVVKSRNEALALMKKGIENRRIVSANRNEEGSHLIFKITIESREHNEGPAMVSEINLVDLAGSEITDRTGVRFKDGVHTNKAMSKLVPLIIQLSENPNKQVNYHDSKLIQILQNSLGLKAKTIIICTVNPAVVKETIATLEFAKRVNSIKNTSEMTPTTSASTRQLVTPQQSSSLEVERPEQHVPINCNGQNDDNTNITSAALRNQDQLLHGMVQPECSESAPLKIRNSEVIDSINHESCVSRMLYEAEVKKNEEHMKTIEQLTTKLDSTNLKLEEFKINLRSVIIMYLQNFLTKCEDGRAMLDILRET